MVNGVTDRVLREELPHVQKLGEFHNRHIQEQTLCSFGVAAPQVLLRTAEYDALNLP